MSEVLLSRLVETMDRFSSARILVVGDVMLDHYIWGRVERISPEAPVAVVGVTNDSYRLGGAANVAHNISRLGGAVSLLSVAGNDGEGLRIREDMERIGIDTSGLLLVPGRPTTTKSRVMAHNQQLLRIDREVRSDIPDETQKEALELFSRALDSVQAVIFSDYAKGMLVGPMVRSMIDMARDRVIPVFVDPKIASIDFFRGATLLTPNHLEASRSAGIEITDEATLLLAGQVLLDRTSSQAVLITRGEAGMTLFEGGESLHASHIPAVAQDVFDVTGAGDTVMATLTLAHAAGASLLEAAVLSNLAAGIVVGMVGTSTVNREQLREVLTLSSLFETNRGVFRPAGFRPRVRL
ncbi:MAG: D-glycero-beta-D-manno-heptose-7-phosphate kinase [Nitrospirae bacterium]|nr:D-glycero-beta-D-manno-heptose-7-phosphate kinase [Nitrospirota bacterium]